MATLNNFILAGLFFFVVVNPHPRIFFSFHFLERVEGRGGE